MSSSNNSPALQGFLRSDGRKGIRNCIVVAYLVECAHHVAREIVDSFRGQPVHLIGFGGCYPNAYADRMMNTLCTPAIPNSNPAVTRVKKAGQRQSNMAMDG